ncbi:MAG: orotidine-5'-phosphate decarboxylase [Elusimicrobiota bacterium]|jgi:orotidine-5'-phosphate decarboxylase
MTNTHPPTELIVALDLDSVSAAEQLIDKLHGKVRYYKVGLRMFLAHGRRVIDLVRKRDGEVFLDLKLHDIPQTVAHAVQEAQAFGVFSLSLHMLGGADMLKAAAETHPRPRLWGVTVLTSMNDADVKALHPNAAVHPLARRLAEHGRRHVDGIICSGHEVAALREDLGAETTFITPGIRLPGGDAHDQKRHITPAEASALGIRYIVVGRPIALAEDPSRTAQTILEQLAVRA